VLSAAGGKREIQAEQWTAIPFDLQVRAVCAPCNSGWMEDLEAATRPILTPMLEDRAVELGTDDQLVLSRWATMAIMVAQHTHPLDQRTIGGDRFQRFHWLRELPRGAQIWIGRYDGSGPWPTNYQHLALHISEPHGPSPARPNGYLTAFSIGYVAFVYYGHDMENGPSWHSSSAQDLFLNPIWPSPGKTVRWPPPGLLEADGLQAAIRSFPLHI
jgi:hypothetical protein